MAGVLTGAIAAHFRASGRTSRFVYLPLLHFYCYGVPIIFALVYIGVQVLVKSRVEQLFATYVQLDAGLAAAATAWAPGAPLLPLLGLQSLATAIAAQKSSLYQAVEAGYAVGMAWLACLFAVSGPMRRPAVPVDADAVMAARQCDPSDRAESANPAIEAAEATGFHDCSALWRTLAAGSPGDRDISAGRCARSTRCVSAAHVSATDNERHRPYGALAGASSSGRQSLFLIWRQIAAGYYLGLFRALRRRRLTAAS
jgi:hypothetical protein